MSEGIFTIHRYEIECPIGKQIELNPFGDIHRFEPLCHVHKWREWCEKERTKTNAFYIGMGDYDGIFSASERKAMAAANLHDASYQGLDGDAKRRVEMLCDEIKFMKGRLVGLIEGNHHYTFQSGVTSTQMMCEILKCRYLGTSSFIRLVFFQRNGKRHSMAIDMWAHHGVGASRAMGSSVTELARMAEVANADIYLAGHDHKRSITTRSRLELTQGRSTINLRNHKVLLARTGAFLKGYVADRQSYVSQKNLPPTDLGTVSIKLTPKRDQIFEERNVKATDMYVDIEATL